jgi:hypothetical protein
MRTDEKALENKGVKTKSGDLTSGAGKGKSFDNFDGGPEPFSLVSTDPRMYGEFRGTIDDKAIIQRLQNKNIYEVTLSNKGGLVLPVIIEWTYKDGSKEIERIPAEIWRINETKVTKVFVKEKEVAGIVLDPQQELTDVNATDNVFPKQEQSSKFDDFKKKAN